MASQSYHAGAIVALRKELDQEAMTIQITRYGSRYWAVFVNRQLLCVTVYKKGALAVRDALLNGGVKAGRAQESD